MGAETNLKLTFQLYVTDEDKEVKGFQNFLAFCLAKIFKVSCQISFADYTGDGWEVQLAKERKKDLWMKASIAGV